MSAKVSDKVAKRRLLQLADFLENDVPEAHFDFCTFGETRFGSLDKGTDVLEKHEACGTKACALGWAPALPFAKKLGFSLSIDKNGYADFHKNGRPVTTATVWRQLFGIKDSQADLIFFNSQLNLKNGTACAYAQSDKYDVACGIRTFVAARYG